MISSLYSKGALTRSLMVAHAGHIGCQTSAQAQAETAICRARSSDPVTSKQAAVNAENFAATHAGRIAVALAVMGSGTANEISQITGLSVVQVDRRLPEMQRAGLARVLEGIDGKALTRSGFRIWAATEL
jgi:hypothetical protein